MIFKIITAIIILLGIVTVLYFGFFGIYMIFDFVRDKEHLLSKKEKIFVGGPLIIVGLLIFFLMIAFILGGILFLI